MLQAHFAIPRTLFICTLELLTTISIKSRTFVPHISLQLRRKKNQNRIQINFVQPTHESHERPSSIYVRRKIIVSISRGPAKYFNTKWRWRRVVVLAQSGGGEAGCGGAAGSTIFDFISTGDPSRTRSFDFLAYHKMKLLTFPRFYVTEHTIHAEGINPIKLNILTIKQKSTVSEGRWW